MRRCSSLLLEKALTKAAGLCRGSNYYGKYERMYRRDLRKIPSLRLVADFAKDRTLELGCGIGYLSRLFDSYVGTDIQIQALKIARKQSRAPFLQADIGNLPFRDAAFDTVILYDVAEHLENLDRILTELKRIASKAVISFMDIDSYYRWFTYDDSHRSRETVREILPLLKGHYRNVMVHKTSGVFSLPPGVNSFLGKYFPNQVVIECFD